MGTTIIINDERMGGGPEELGAKLMGTFLRKLCAEPMKPATIVFYNAGVKLLAKGTSGVLDAIEILKGAGVDLVACGTCIDYFKLQKDVAFGRVSSMQEIIPILMRSEKVVTIS
jgi:intracellular sulfur oxidation DsrE/DsrF family protein